MHKLNAGEKPYRQEQDESELIMKASNVSKAKQNKNTHKKLYKTYIISIYIRPLINMNYDKYIILLQIPTSHKTVICSLFAIKMVNIFKEKSTTE